MRIGITGVTGFIGTALAKAAVGRGHEIVAYSRRKDMAFPWAKEVRAFDPALNAVLDPSGLDVLVHLAGENVLGYWTANKKARIRDSRVQTTQKIVSAMRDCAQRPQAFICASASGVYGNRGDEVLTESSPRGAGFLADVCEEWESAAMAADAFGVRIAMLRTGMVLGRDGGAWPLLRRIFSLGLGSRLGSGSQWVPWIHVDDEVGIILHTIEQSFYHGPVNLAAPEHVSNAQLTRAIAAQLGRFTLPPVPAFMLRLVLRDLSGVVLDSQRMVPKAALEGGYAFAYPSLKQALAALV